MGEQSNISTRFIAQDELSPVLRTMQAALAQLAQQGTQTSQVLAKLGTSTQQIAQAQTANVSSANQLTASYLALAQATRGQSQVAVSSQATMQATAQVLAQLVASTQQSAQQQAQAAQTTAQLTAALSQLSASLQATAQTQSQLQQAVQANTQALQAQGQASEQAGQGVQRFGGVVRTATGFLAAFGVVLSVQTLVNFAKSVIETGAKLEQLRLSVIAVSGSQREGQRVLVDTSALANRLGLSTTSLTESYRSLAAATRGTALEGAGTARLFENVTLAARTLGSTNEQTGRAFLALQQIVSKGTLSMEELRGQLGEALPGALQVAARAMGVTTAELQKLVEKGTVDGVAFAKLFGEQLRKEVGGGAEAAAQSASSAFQRLENEWTALKDRIAQSGPLRLVATVAGGLASTLNATTVREQAIQTSFAERADRAAGPTPRDTTVPGILASATQAERDRLLEGERELFAIAQARATLDAADTSRGAQVRAEATRQRELTHLREIDALLATIEIRRQQAGKLQSTAEPGSDGSTDLFAKARELEDKARTRLDALEKELRALDRRVAIAIQGQTAGRALELTSAARDDRATLTEKALEEATALLTQRPTGFGAPVVDLQRRLGSLGRGVGGPQSRQESEAQVQRLLEVGRKELAELTLNPTFLTALELADAKLKSWQKTLEKVGEEQAKLRESVGQQARATPGGTVSPYRGLIGPIAAERGIDPSIIEALITQESGNNPRAVSLKGAKGLGQFMPATAAQYRIAGKEFEPEANIRATVNYLADLLAMFSGDIHKALTAYNAGPRNGGIPSKTGENAGFADQVLARQRGQGAGGAGGRELAGLRGDVEAAKTAVAQDKYRIDAAAAEDAAQEKAIATLARLTSAYTQTKEARDEDTAGVLAAQFPQNAAIQQASELVLRLASTRAAYKEEVAALAERFTALKQSAEAQRENEDAQAAYNKKLEDTLRLLNAPKDERKETQLRSEAPGGVTTAAQDRQLELITSRKRVLTEAEAQAKRLEGIYRDVSRSIEDSLAGAFFNAFEQGGFSGQQFGLSLLQGLQQTFQQLSKQLVTSLLNAATGATGGDSGGGWLGALAGIAVKAAGAYFGGGLTTGVDTGLASTGPGADFSQSGASLFDTNTAFRAQGGVVPAMQPMSRYASAFAGMQPLALAEGGIISKPTFAVIGEGGPGKNEAIVPLPDGRSIPVTMQGSQQAPRQEQSIIINLSQSFEGTIDPRSLRTTPSEIIAVIAKDVSTDGISRRVIMNHTR